MKEINYEMRYEDITTGAIGLDVTYSCTLLSKAFHKLISFVVGVR